MSEQYKGTIQKVHNSRGRWSLLMDDDEWYGLGRKKPVYKDGSDVQDGDTALIPFEYNQSNGRTFRNAVEGETKFKQGDGPSKKSGGSGGKRSGGGGSNYQQKEQYWADKELRDIDTQKRIGFAGALNTATTLVNSMLDREIIKLTGKSLAAKADAYRAIVLAEAEALYKVIQLTPNNYESLMADPVEKKEVLEDDLDDGGDDAPDQQTGDDEDDWD